MLPALEPLESRLLLSAVALPEMALASPGVSALPAILAGPLGFDGDTSAFFGDSQDALVAAVPTGESYMLYEHWGGTWYDAEKLPGNTEDDLMCWAAAASNALEWTGWGLVDGMTTTDDMFQYFQDHWTDEGSLMEFGWDWWFDGTNPSEGWSGWSQVDVPGGGFYPTENFADYYHRTWEDAQTLSGIDSYLHSGYSVTLGIYGPGGHAITCWGYNYDPATSDYLGVWVTDSDDSKFLSDPPDAIHYYEVAYSGSAWYLQDYYGSDAWYIGEVMALEAYTEAPPTVTIEATDAAAAEASEDPGTFTVTRTGATAGDMEVFYTIGGTAANGADYQTISASVVIPDGSASATVVITPIDDMEEEGNETVILTLTDAPAYTVGAQDSDTVNIADDDLILVDDRAIAETTPHGARTAGSLTNTHAGDDSYEALTEERFGGKKSRLEHRWTFDVTGGSTVTFFVEAYHDSAVEDFAFEYSTDGASWTPMLTVTKTADDDTAQSFDLPAATGGTVYVRVVDTNRRQRESGLDTLYVDEMFIRSDLRGALPEVTIAATDDTAAEAGAQTGTFTVTRSGGTAGAMEVFYTIGGTADNGVDYAALAGSVIIPDGSASATVTVTPVDDLAEEGTEKVTLTLTDMPAYRVGSPASDTVTIADDDLVLVDDHAIAETTQHGDRTAGNLTNTYAGDDTYEALTEAKFGGNKSRLEHRWTFDVTGGGTVTFFVEAHHDSAVEDFAFEYSTDGVTWTTMLTVTKTADNDTAQSFVMPATTSGTVFVRVVDTNRSRKESALDTLYVDEMFIRSE